MSTINDGGPAFPICDLSLNNVTGESTSHQSISSGLSMRDYFAVHANIGDVDELLPQQGELLLGRPCPPYATEFHACMAWWSDFRATLRYIDADAMLRAREVKP